MNKVLLSCFLLIIIHSAFSQITDSTGTQETDTVIIKEDPIIIKQTINLLEIKQAKWYVFGNVKIFKASDNYAACKGYEAFLNKVSGSIKSGLNYGFGIDIIYAPKKIVFSAGINYNLYSEKFKYVNDSSQTFTSENKSRYVSLDLKAGYWFLRNKKHLSFMILAGPVVSQVLSYSGMNLEPINTNQPQPISSLDRYNSTQYGVVADYLLFYQLRKYKLCAGVSYNYGFQSITKDYQPYSQMRNVLSIRFGIVYGL